MRVRIVILNWNGIRWLEGCFAALERQQTDRVDTVLVDNASSDGSLAFVRERFPWVRVLALDSNVGYARGNNLGAAGADADALVFLNNDTEVAPGWLAALIAVAEADPSVGLVTSRVVFLDRPHIVDSAGDGYLRCGGAYKLGHGQAADQTGGAREVFGACGAAFLIRRSLFERLGGFDERFFMVYEDVDLSYRARLTGARVVYAPAATVGHAGSASLGRVSARAVFYGQRNLEWTWYQNSPGPILRRSFVPHVLYGIASGLAYARQGQFVPWIRGKVAALRGLPDAQKARRRVQASTVVAPDAIWQLMDADWIGVKRREKRYEFSSTARTPGD